MLAFVLGNIFWGGEVVVCFIWVWVVCFIVLFGVFLLIYLYLYSPQTLEWHIQITVTFLFLIFIFFKALCHMSLEQCISMVCDRAQWRKTSSKTSTCIGWLRLLYMNCSSVTCLLKLLLAFLFICNLSGLYCSYTEVSWAWLKK